MSPGRTDRAAIAAIVTAIMMVPGCWVIYRSAWLPLECSIQEKSLQARTERDMTASSPSAVVAARNRLEEVTTLIARGCRNPNMYMIAAANARALQNRELAIEFYSSALRYDRRPEIYFQLGSVEYERGNVGACLAHFKSAVRFNPALLQEVPPPIRPAIAASLKRTAAPDSR